MNNFAKIIPKKFLKKGATVREDAVDAKLREITITKLKNPFQVIIDDGRGPFTRFLKSGCESGGIQKVCDAILFSNNGNDLQPIFVELKSSISSKKSSFSPKIRKNVRLKMKGTDAILHYYLKILKNFYNLATNMHEPYRVLFYLGREQKRDKEVEKRKDLYIRWPVENDGDSIPFEEIRNAWRNRNHEFH